MTHNTVQHPGLQGVIAVTSRLSRVDGLAGELLIAGYALEDIAPQATFEEMVYLLWHDKLPTAPQLANFQAALCSLRSLPAIAYDVLVQAAEANLPMMDALRMATDVITLNSPSAQPMESAKHLVAAMPTIVAAYWRLQHQQQPITPHDELSHAANLLYMLDGTAPDEHRVRALDTYLNTVIDHGLNASTFAARVIISTQSDMVSAIVGAIGALKGPIHGGAPGPALDMVFEIGTPDQAEPYLRAKLDRGERLMGFGHRVYKVRDPRADVLNTAAQRLFVPRDDRDLYDLARHVETVAVRLLEEYKPDRKLQTNVEFYTALILHGLGFDTALFTPTFAVARVGGWTAHALEHLQRERLLRPLLAYDGDVNRHFISLDQR